MAVVNKLVAELVEIGGETELVELIFESIENSMEFRKNKETLNFWNFKLLICESKLLSLCLNLKLQYLRI